MTDTSNEPGSLLLPVAALAAIGLGYLWASWSAREVALAERTRARLA